MQQYTEAQMWTIIEKNHGKLVAVNKELKSIVAVKVPMPVQKKGER